MNTTKQVENKLSELITEISKLIDFMPRLLKDTCLDEEYGKEATKNLIIQREHFKRISEEGFLCAGFISYYDYGLEWLQDVRLLEFTSLNKITMDIHECVIKIINLDVEITKLMHNL